IYTYGRGYNPSSTNGKYVDYVVYDRNITEIPDEAFGKVGGGVINITVSDNLKNIGTSQNLSLTRISEELEQANCAIMPHDYIVKADLASTVSGEYNSNAFSSLYSDNNAIIVFNTMINRVRFKGNVFNGAS